ncbi:DNA helicase RecG, partial [Arthrospira platensis SPKY1]|nr:DNA helicase RecG [Arthrospira platensis SPKY1]
MEKGNRPHVLLLSATPIPRSLSMALYGDLDISQIRQKPAGRQPVKTAIRTEEKREDVYRFIEDELGKGNRVYIIYPLVEESEKMDLKNATDGFENLSRRFA